MSTKLERELAEQILAGNSERPAEGIFRRGLEAFVTARKRLRPLFGPALTARNRVVRCRIPGRRRATVLFWVGSYSYLTRQRYKNSDPETGLTRVEVSKEERLLPEVVIQVELPNGSRDRVSSASSAATELAYRCQGSPERVARVCAAIERARKRCFELAEQTTRWF